MRFRIEGTVGEGEDTREEFVEKDFTDLKAAKAYAERKSPWKDIEVLITEVEP